MSRPDRNWVDCRAAGINTWCVTLKSVIYLKNVNLKSSLLLFASCFCGVGVTGCVFELAYGSPKFGALANYILLAAGIPVMVAFFLGAVKVANAQNEE